MNFVKQILTEMDNETFSSPRIAGFLAMATFIGLTVSDFIVNRKFDCQAFGIGAGSMVATLGAAIKMGEKA